MYNFIGEEWIPGEITVISWIERELVDVKGNRFKAKAFVEENPVFRIAGRNPFLSPVPLEELEHFELRYKSPTTVTTRGEETIAQVEIFEYFP